MGFPRTSGGALEFRVLARASSPGEGFHRLMGRREQLRVRSRRVVTLGPSKCVAPGSGVLFVCLFVRSYPGWKTESVDVRRRGSHGLVPVRCQGFRPMLCRPRNGSPVAYVKVRWSLVSLGANIRCKPCPYVSFGRGGWVGGGPSRGAHACVKTVYVFSAPTPTPTVLDSEAVLASSVLFRKDAS